MKDTYFSPSEPSTIQPIADRMYGLYANISRKNVTHILKSLETSTSGGACRPRSNRTLFMKPGIIAIDNFFPLAHGWALEAPGHRLRVAGTTLAANLENSALRLASYVPRRKGTDAPAATGSTSDRAFGLNMNAHIGDDPDDISNHQKRPRATPIQLLS